MQNRHVLTILSEWCQNVMTYGHLGPIHTIPDSSCTTSFTESDIKILHVRTISDSVLDAVHTTPLHFIHVTETFV